MTAPLSLRTPSALIALNHHPLLRASVESSLSSQIVRITASMDSFNGRRTGLAELLQVVQKLEGGLIALEGPPGSGVTTLLAHLAATQPCAFWFGDDDGGQGAAALCAQLIALHQLGVPLVSPVANSDPAALEQVLAEVSQRATEKPALVLLDPWTCPAQPRSPFPLPLPFRLPPRVIVVYGCTPAMALPWVAQARVTLPLSGDETLQDQIRVLRELNCPSPWYTPIITAAQGNFLYIRLAAAMIHAGLLDMTALPVGLEALHAAWWERCDADARRLALLAAAAIEPLPTAMCAELLGTDPADVFADGTFVVGNAQGDDPSQTVSYQLRHWSTRDYLACHHAPALAQAHADVVALALQADGEPGDWRSNNNNLYSHSYLARHFARHAALSPPHTQAHALPAVAQRSWVRAQERYHGGMNEAAQDMAWELKSAIATGPVLRLVRNAALAGTLASLARVFSPDAALAALVTAQECSGREAGLKRVLELVEQLPDGRDKAQILRRLGEVCYSIQMRAAAMRLLSRALDLEEQSFPRIWREQRDQLHMALSEAALNLGAVAAALEISARISHIERRAMAETQIVRWLLAAGDLARAGDVARSIVHESQGAWARSEVAVALARAGDLPAAEALLIEVNIETAAAWAQIELACDAAAEDEDAARVRIERLNSPHQHDRGLARLAHALALADKDGDALAAAEQIRDVEVRVSALLDLRLQLEGLVAMLALEEATRAIGALKGDARAPLIAGLAAAHAALGRRERALHLAEQLSAGEERDRALSRVAVAFARQGNHWQGQAIAYTLADDDERDWALDELTRLLAEDSRWRDAQDLALEIKAEDQRARTLADLAIARARADDPLAALRLAQSILVAAERTRALMLIAPLLVAAGYTDEALAAVDNWQSVIDTVQPGSKSPSLSAGTEASRYLTVIATTLAEQGNLEQAQTLTNDIARPLDRARVYLAMAATAVRHNPALTTMALGTALQVAHMGREEAFRLLEHAVPVLALLGGAALLIQVAAAIDEIDNW